MAPASTHARLKALDDGKTAAAGRLSPGELRKLDAYWRASNYPSVGQIYLLDNPLLREPLKREHIKPRLLGHWGTSPSPYFVEGRDPEAVHQQLAGVLDAVVAEIKQIWADARAKG